MLLFAQFLGGISAAAVTVLTILVITDLTTGTGRFNLVRGAIGTLIAIAASISTTSLTTAISALERDLGGALFHRKPSIALTGLGRMVRPHLDEIARNADHAREVARTLTPRPSVHRSARHAVESSEQPSN